MTASAGGEALVGRNCRDDDEGGSGDDEDESPAAAAAAASRALARANATARIRALRFSGSGGVGATPPAPRCMVGADGGSMLNRSAGNQVTTTSTARQEHEDAACTRARGGLDIMARSVEKPAEDVRENEGRLLREVFGFV